jgi:hypothetical protein
MAKGIRIDERDDFSTSCPDPGIAGCAQPSALQLQDLEWERPGDLKSPVCRPIIANEHFQARVIAALQG